MAIEAREGSLPEDASNEPIQVARTYIQEDATTPTSLKSPLTVSATELELKPPTNATNLVMTPLTNDLRFGRQDPLTDGNKHAVFTVGNYISLPVADLASVWVMRDSADVALQFHFETL